MLIQKLLNEYKTISEDIK